MCHESALGCAWLQRRRWRHAVGAQASADEPALCVQELGVREVVLVASGAIR